MIEDTFPIIETERLVLRQITKEDAGDILKYLSDKDVMKHYGLEPFESLDDALDEIRWYQSIFEDNTGIRWGITLKGQDRVIGSCGFLNIVSEHSRSEIGFELSKDYWGQGIASEAIEAVTKYGFEQLNLQRIQALVEPPNISSQKLVERKGFILEGLLRNYEYTCGKLDDLYMYSLLKQDYDKPDKGEDISVKSLAMAQLNNLDDLVNIDEEVIGNNSRRDSIRKAIEEERCIVAYNKSLVVGFLIFDTQFFDCSFISLIIVRPSERRKGHASSLIEYFTKISPTKKIFSSTNKSNQAMQEVFKVNGFIHSGYISNLDEGDPEIIYFKSK